MSENQQDPWGRNNDKPKDIDEWIDQNLKKLFGYINNRNSGNGKGNNGSGSGSGGNNFLKLFKVNKWLVSIFIIVILAIAAYSSVFQVQPGEIGVILRFGKHERSATPGLNFLIPIAETLVKVNVEVVRSIEFKTNPNNASYDKESSMVTADRNVININWVVQYRVKEPESYLFNIQNVTSTINDFSEYVLRRLVGNRDFDYILNRREELAFSSYTEIQELLDKYKSGVEIVALQLLDVTPPEEVKAAFNEVNEADQDKTRLVNEAQKEANQKIPKARGDAKRLILEAEGYAINRINEAKGNADRFNSVYTQYSQFKNVTRTELYVSTLEKVLPQVEEVIVIDKKGNLLPLLNLNNSAK